MQIKKFIGIDVSKESLDITVVEEGLVVYYRSILNTSTDIKVFFKHLFSEVSVTIEESVFCMEYTGIYNLPFVRQLQRLNAKIWMESGAQIKKSIGLVRGKNDKVDSGRIAMYAFANRHRIKLWAAPRPIIAKISVLLGQRSRMIKSKKQLTVPIGEQKKFLNRDIMKSVEKHNHKTIAALNDAINAIEKEILSMIRDDQSLLKHYKIITSVDGVGPITAFYIITTTNEFINISDAKKYACYSGIAPFEHTSGTSIRGKTRVSHLANKTIKSLLHLAAISSIRMKGELREYFERKVAEGKNKMSVINAIRNKIIQRIFLCVKQERLFIRKQDTRLV